MVIEVLEGDITKLEVDAIVNPANSLMGMLGGLAYIIKVRGGDIIEKEALEKAPVPIGKAVITTAGRLPCKYVIHSPTVSEPGSRSSIDNVRKAVRAALRVASEHNIKTVAFPGMGTGVGGLRVYDAVKAMCNEIKRCIDEGLSFKRIILVAYGKEAYREFLRAFKEVFRI